MKRSRNVAEMRRPYEGACIIRKQSSKPQAKNRARPHRACKPTHWTYRAWKAKRTKRCQAHLWHDTRQQRSAHIDTMNKGLHDKASNGKSRPATTPACQPRRPPSQTAVRFATITLNQKAGLQRFATSRLFCISNKLERTRHSAQPQQPRARRRRRPTAFRQWREASLPQSPLSSRACPRQPAQASR